MKAKERETLEKNKELYEDIQEKFSGNVNYMQILNLIPSYAEKEIISEFNIDDISLNLFLINLLKFRGRWQEEKCDFLVPVFIPVPLKEDCFKLINSLYHSTEEQTDQLARVLFENFGFDSKSFLFDYFVNVCFPNLYQHFLSINNCESAASILRSLITYAKFQSQAAIFATCLVSTFILNCYPFIQEFRQNFTYKTLFVGGNDFPEPITPFNDSFSESIIYLTKHHISILKYFFDELSDMQETLIDKLFTGLFFNIQTMNQYIFKYLHLNKEDVAGKMLEIIKGLFKNDSAGYTYPNFEEDLFYNSNIRFTLTRADVYVLSEINNVRDDKTRFDIFLIDNLVMPEMTMNDAFSIYFRNRTIESDTKKQTKPSVPIDSPKTDLNKWDAIKDQALIKGIDPISLLDFKTNDATLSLDIFKKECQANKKMEDILRDRMKSITYLKQIKQLISQVLSETFLSYAKFDLGTQQTVDVNVKWNTFAVNFLKVNISRYLTDTSKSPLTAKSIKLIEDTHFELLPNEDFEDFVQYFTDFQNAILLPYLSQRPKAPPELPKRKTQQSIKKDATPNKYSTMFHWLQTLLQYEELFTFNKIEIDSNIESKITFNTEQNSEPIVPFYKVSNLLKYVNEAVIDESESGKKTQKGVFMKIFSGKPQFSNEFIAHFIVAINEIYQEINDWKRTYELEEEEMKCRESDPNDFGRDDDDDDDEEPNIYEVDVPDLVFSTVRLEFKKIYRIINEITQTNPLLIPPQHIEALNQMKEVFEKRKTSK